MEAAPVGRVEKPRGHGNELDEDTPFSRPETWALRAARFSD
jgi:hypothetical protein